NLCALVRLQRAAGFMGRYRSCLWSRQRCVRKRSGEGAVDPTRACYAGRLADDFRNCPIVSSWVCPGRKSGTLSLDCHGSLLPAISCRYRVGAHVSASLLAPAATDRGAATKYFSYYPARCSHARVGVRRRKLSYLFLVRCRA